MSLFKLWSESYDCDFKFVDDDKNLKGIQTFVVANDKDQLAQLSSSFLHPWQMDQIEDKEESFEFDFSNERQKVHGLYSREKKEGELWGSFDSNSVDIIRKFIGRRYSENHIYEIVFGALSLNGSQIISVFAEALVLAAYRFKNKKSKTFSIKIPKGQQEEFGKAFVKAQAVNFSRFLVDLPANLLNPLSYEELIKELVSKNKNFKFESLSKNLESQGYGLIHAVGKGAEHPPRMVKVISCDKKSKSKSVAFVGKGITFDSGGLDLKPSRFMRLMKKDMGGSAALAGLLYYLVHSEELDINCEFYFALAENSISASSFRPGDVYVAGNGLSVEIDNTDAEGRLALADALSWMGKDCKHIDTVIDVATLTGAIKVGLGAYVGGLFSNNKDLSDQLMESSKNTGDFMWPMPIPYWTEKEVKKSNVADLVNSTASGYGGAITAAQFLKQFVPSGLKWAHLDIYAWTDSKRGALRQSGGSGQGTLILIDWLTINKG